MQRYLNKGLALERSCRLTDLDAVIYYTVIYDLMYTHILPVKFGMLWLNWVVVFRQCVRTTRFILKALPPWPPGLPQVAVSARWAVRAWNSPTRHSKTGRAGRDGPAEWFKAWFLQRFLLQMVVPDVDLWWLDLLTSRFLCFCWLMFGWSHLVEFWFLIRLKSDHQR